MIELRPCAPGDRCVLRHADTGPNASEALATYIVTHSGRHNTPPQQGISLCSEHARDYVFALVLNGVARW